MRNVEPEFDQWTDQNHVPYFPNPQAESQRNTSAPHLNKGLNLLWHSILKLFGLSQTDGSVAHKHAPSSLL